VQELRRTGLLTWAGGKIRILDFEGLAALAAFDPTYLSLMHERR
jgi:hypothetical protein